MKLDFDKICHVVIILLLIATFIGFFRKCQNKPDTNLQKANDSLQAELLKRDSAIQVSTLKITEFQKKEVILVEENKNLRKRIDLIEAKRHSEEVEVYKLSSDTIYRLLQDTYSTTEELKPYPFSPTQVRSIYITNIKLNSLLRSDSTYKLLVGTLDEQLTLKDQIISQQSLQIEDYQVKDRINEKIIVNKDELQKASEQEIKHQKTEKFFWKLGTIAGGVATVAVLIAL